MLLPQTASLIAWSPGIGDPTFVGWLTVIVYFGTAALSLRAMQAVPRVAKKAHGRQALIFWFSLFLGLVALGINKQLDLQTLFTEIAREVLWVLGVYNDRRMYQVTFILALALTGLFFSLRVAREMKAHHKTLIRSVFGVALLVVFVVVRAASFHHFDRLLGTQLLGLRMNWALELGALTIIAWGALGYREAGRRGTTENKR